MSAPLTAQDIDTVSHGLAGRLYPSNPRPRALLASRLREAMTGETTREGQDRAGAAVLREVAEAKAVRSCRLDPGECARRCDVLPGGCDVYGEGLEADGRGCRVAGRTVVGEDGRVSVQLELVPALDTT